MSVKTCLECNKTFELPARKHGCTKLYCSPLCANRYRQRKYNATHKKEHHAYYVAHRNEKITYAADWQKKNPTKVKEARHKRYRKDLPKSRQKAREAARKWREENRELVNQKAREYRLKNLAKVYERDRKWRAKNTAKVQGYRRKGRKKRNKERLALQLLALTTFIEQKGPDHDADPAPRADQPPGPLPGADHRTAP